MSIKIAIVEDDDALAKTFEEYTAQYSAESGEKITVTRFSDGDQIVNNYQPVYDIIFMDIQMKRLDGMSAAQKIRDFDNNVILIFITNMPQYAIKGYSVKALDYLLKPVEYFVFSQQLKKSIKTIRKKRPHFLLVPYNNTIVKLATSDILYIESFKHQMIVYTKDTTYNFISTMKELEVELSDSNFFRCNHYYLVNLAHVDVINGYTVTIDKHTLTISRARKKDFIRALNVFIRGGG